MRLSISILGILALLGTNAVRAQSVLSITVVDSATNAALHGCTVTLLTKDGANTFNEYYQRVPIANGPCTVRVSHVSYEEKSIQIEVLGDTALTIPLARKSIGIDEVAVSRERSVTMEKGNIVLWPTEMFGSQNMWEVIKSSGYVEATESGELSIRQKRSTVYINNRKLYFSGEELKSHLQAMPGNMIKKIEVIPNPDASHAADELTVIRIVTKDSDYVGYRMNAHITGIQGLATSNGQSLKTDYSDRNYDLQWSVSRNESAKKPRSAYGYDLGQNHWDIRQNTSARSETYSTFLLFNYYPNKKNNLSVYLDYADASNRSDVQAENMSNGVLPDGSFLGNNTLRGDSRSFNVHANYVLKNDSGNRTLKIQVDALQNKTGSQNESRRKLYGQDAADVRLEDIERDVLHAVVRSSYGIETLRFGFLDGRI